MLVQTAARQTFSLRMRSSVAAARSMMGAQVLSTFSANQTTVAFHGSEARSPLVTRVPNPVSTSGSLAGKNEDHMAGLQQRLEARAAELLNSSQPARSTAQRASPAARRSAVCPELDPNDGVHRTIAGGILTSDHVERRDTGGFVSGEC